MANETVINPALQQSSPTAINNEIVEQYNRQNGIGSQTDQPIKEGTEICPCRN